MTEAQEQYKRKKEAKIKYIILANSFRVFKAGKIKELTIDITNIVIPSKMKFK